MPATSARSRRVAPPCDSVAADTGKRVVMVTDSLEQPYWYAIQTRSKHEKVVRDQFVAKCITHLLPVWRKRSVWKDRVKILEVPLFTGYLFGYFALREKLTVLNTVGVVRLVGIHGTPVAVPEEQIAAIRTMMQQRLPYDPHPYLSTGMRVRIIRGVLTGVEGILVAKRQRYRLVLSVDLLQKAVAVDVESGDVEPLEPHVNYIHNATRQRRHNPDR